MLKLCENYLKTSLTKKLAFTTHTAVQIVMSKWILQCTYFFHHWQSVVVFPFIFLNVNFCWLITILPLCILTPKTKHAFENVLRDRNTSKSDHQMCCKINVYSNIKQTNEQTKQNETKSEQNTICLTVQFGAIN